MVPSSQMQRHKVDQWLPKTGGGESLINERGSAGEGGKVVEVGGSGDCTMGAYSMPLDLKTVKGEIFTYPFTTIKQIQESKQKADTYHKSLSTC